MKRPCCARERAALGEATAASSREADRSMTVRASPADGATTRHPEVAAGHLGPEERDARERRRVIGRLRGETRLPAGGDQDRILAIQSLLHLDHVVGTSKPEGVDLKPSWQAVPARPIKRLWGDTEARSFQVDFRVRMAIVEGWGKNPGLHSHDSANEVVKARSTQSVSDLGLE